ncbi:LPD38 domain-containing protein [Aeromonas popoffii]|uniref:LPD38 domain-containing protein n=1 Tax=Aeromonas popoffii TaxID=70856 RepID=UPI0005A88BC3|nr:LPD38 domain-containing protein [Aeromonas popoffii]
MDKPGLRDALPQPQSSDTRTDPFWSNIDSNLSATSAALAPTPAKAAPARNLEVGLGDLARGIGAGALELVGGIGELAGQASEFGKENAGKQGGDYLEQARANLASKLSPVLDFVAGAGDLAKSGAESLTEGMSSDAKEAMNRRLVDETPEGRLIMGDGAGDIDVWAMKMAQGVGSLVPTLLAGGVTGVAAKVSIGRAVTASMVKRGATQQVAEAVAAKTVSRLATGAAVTTGATGSVGSAGVNTKESVLGMSYDELAASDTFRQAFTRIDQDQQTLHLTDDEKLALAREETANVASRATMSDAKTWGAAAMGSMMGDAMLFKMLAGKMVAGGMLKGAAKGALGEGIGETLEEGVQQYAVNASLNEVAAADIDPMKGVVSSALEGGLIGMGTGGVVGAAGGLRGGPHVNEGATNPTTEPASPVVDEATGPMAADNPAPLAEQAQENGPDLATAVDEQAELGPTSVEQNPLGPSKSQFDEVRDVPAYLRQDDTAERFKGMAEDTEVQRALAGDFGESIQELIASQMEGGEQGPSFYELAQSGALGVDPFAGNKTASQVAAEGHKPKALRAPTEQEREIEGYRQTAEQKQKDSLAQREALQSATFEPGIESQHAAEAATQVRDQSIARAGSETDSIFGPLQSLRITRKGKPFASKKEAQLASRKGKETPVPLNGGGFGVAEIAEVEHASATNLDDTVTSQPQAEVSNEPVTPVPAISSERQGDQPGAGQQAATGSEPTTAELAGRTRTGDPAELAPDLPAPDGSSRDDPALKTAPATDAGVVVSGATISTPTPWTEAINNPDGTITLKGDLPMIKRWAKDTGVKVIPGKGGLVVAKSSATKVQELAKPAASEPELQLEAARAEVAPAPTDAQKETGNYKKGHLTLQGLHIALENPKGSIRSGTDQAGKAWQSTMAHDYGYIKRTLGADGDHVDVFIGDQPDSETVFIVDQVDPKSGKFDEHKVMMGFVDEAAARVGYLANYEKGWKGLGAIKAMPVEAFKRWLSDGDTTKPAVAGKTEPQSKIADFGEKIGGARKDSWTAYRDTVEGDTAEQIKALPLSKAWPAPDYDKLIESGVDRHAVAIARAARDAIPAKPRVSYKVGNWAQAVKLLRDLSLGLMDGTVDADTAKRVMSSTSLRSAHAIHHRADLYVAVGHQRSLADLSLSLGSYSLYEGVKYNPPKGIWTLSRESKSSVFGNWPRTIASGASKAEVITAFKHRYDQLTQSGSKPKAISFAIYSRRNGQDWIVGKKVGRNHLDLTEAFNNVSDARKYRDDHYDELVSKLEKAKEIPHERRDINLPRVGEDMRGGADVTPELFGEAFGFRGVEFGNWVEQGRRQRDLNHAYDALMDMAAVLGISPKALSLNGELGLAFGARGSGGVNPAAAHYEHGKVVINLTKMNGAGSLGHEWWHALDGYFARTRGQPGDMMTEALDVSLAARESPFIHRGDVRKEMIKAFGAVNRAIKQTALKERSRKLDDKRSKAYWTTDRELSARAFESYLIAKLQDQSASNDYLANIVSEASWDAEAALGMRLDESYPYPTAGEVPAIRAGFDQFFDTIEEREEGAHRILFSKQAMAQGDKPAKHLTQKEAELVTKLWFKQYQGASGIDVQIHATQVELEQSLGLDAKDGLIRRAAFDDSSSTLHVAADTIANPQRMREILRHEVLAHYGLATVLGGGEYTKLMSRLIQSKKDPSMKEVWDWINTHYEDEDIGTQAEEVVAHIAELEQNAWLRGWDKVLSWVKQALRAVGFVPEGITAAETRSLIEGLGKKLKRPDASSIGADGDGLWFSAERSPWQEGFPEVILHGRLGDATSNPDYEAAKGGDDAAARRLVSEVLSPDAIRQLKAVIGDREAIALGVHAEEAVSRNAIPQAMADLLGKVLGIEVSVDIVQAAKVGRTAQNGFGRLALQPGFDGKVRTDKPYLIMDDTLTQGGTLANLKGYIENRGGEVLAATALTGKQYSAKIAIDSSTLEQLREQYDGTGLEAWWQNRFSYGFDSLTESEGRYILRAQDADKIRDRIVAAGYAAPARGEHESPRDHGSLPPDGLKFSQTNTVADKAMEKLNLGPKPDIIDNTKANLAKLRSVDRGVVQSWVDRFIKKANTEVLDALAPIKYAEQAAGIADAADSGYIAARMATGAASTMQATMLYGLPEWKDGVIQRKAGTGEKDALLGIFSDLGTDLHNWLGWMAGHRAEILLRQGRENLLDANDIAALKGVGNGKEAKFIEVKSRWNRLNAATLDLAQEAGLFTAEARAEFESEWYIPFFRESEDGDVIAPFKPKGIANQNAGIKKLKGGEANTNDLLENIFTSTSKLIDASMKNMAAQKIVWNLADTGLIEVVAKPNMMDWRALKNGKDLITVKLEGEDYILRVEDPDLYRAMTFFDRQSFGALVNVAAKAKRLLTAGVTASPEFMLRNFLRDSLSSWVISKDGFKPVIDSIKGVRKTLAMDGSTIDVMFSGASFLGGYVNGNDPTAMADTVRKSLRRKGMTPEQIAKYEKSIIRNAAHAKGVVANAWEKYNRLGEGLENANREAVYDAAIKAGKSHAQAAFESKDLMDFSMLGAARAIQGAAMVLPFFNARLQGLGKLTRELRDNPREIAKRAGMITAMSLGLLAANWDDERYEALPDWDKDTNWHFFIGDQHFRIPKPFEIGVMFGTIPERMVRALGDKDTGAQFGKAVARAVGDTFALNPTPQLVKPMVEAAFNYDSFRGGPIDGPQDMAVRAEARYNEQTSLLMRELGELSGFSPKQLEHLLIGYTGTLGSYVMAAADGLIRASRPGESASWRGDEIPLVKAVYRGTGPAKSTQHMEEFYRMLNEVNQLKRTVDQYRKEGMSEKANELLEEQGGLLKTRRSLSRTQQQVRVVRNKIELLQRDKTLAAAEKRLRIDALLSRRNDLVYQAVNKNRKNWE